MFSVDELYSRNMELVAEKMKIRRHVHTDTGRAFKSLDGCEKPRDRYWEVFGRQIECGALLTVGFHRGLQPTSEWQAHKGYRDR